MEEFIEGYLETVTADPDSAFAMLTPSFQRQSGGIDGYTGFWSTIEKADAREIAASPQDLTVDYTVEYTRTDGSELQDDVSLQLVYQDGDYLIAAEAG